MSLSLSLLCGCLLCVSDTHTHTHHHPQVQQTERKGQEKAKETKDTDVTGASASASTDGDASASPTTASSPPSMSAKSGGGTAVVTVTVRRPKRNASGATEEWHTYTLPVDTAKGLEEVEIADDATGNSARGVRRRLLPPSKLSAREGGGMPPPLPFDGAACVEYRGRTADAALELPSHAVLDVPSGDDASIDVVGADKLPKSLWVTVGLLATEGVAVQLKLKRRKTVAARHCDRASGKLYLYDISGGAVTALIKT